MADIDPTQAGALQARLGYPFRDGKLLLEALTHPSYLQDHPTAGENNQRLEFLGDSVLQLILTRELYALFPDEREGGLSTRRAALMKGSFLAGLARESGLDVCLRLGSSEEASGGRRRLAALEDAFEALIGAIYLDGGFDAASAVALGLYGDLRIRLATVTGAENPKGRLQEKVQPVKGNDALRYEVVGIEGADHARAYEIAVYLQDKAIGRGRGSSKKQAEEEAARDALSTMGETIP